MKLISYSTRKESTRRFNGMGTTFDHTIDVRAWCSNPHHKFGRAKNGTHPMVIKEVLRTADEDELEYQKKLLLEVSKKKPDAVVGVCCTWGFHRSPAMAEILAKFLEDQGIEVEVIHKELK